MDDVDVLIGGMTCGGCASSVRAALVRAPDVRVVDVLIGRARICVASAEGAREGVARALHDAGFTMLAYERRRPSGSHPAVSPKA